MMSKHEKIVQGYIRNMQKVLDINLPEDILSIMMLFYPKYIDFEAERVRQKGFLR